MAVPGRPNGLGDEDEDEDIFVGEEMELQPLDANTYPHLREVAIAAEHGQLDSLRHALGNLSSINEPVEDGDTALHLSCLYGQLPCVQLLLEKGAYLEVKDAENAIPLHDACAGGFTQIVQLLINSTSDPACVKRMLETADVEGDTPLHHAARGEHVDVIRLLLASGASPTKTNMYGKTPGDLAECDTEAKRVLEEAVIAMRGC
ncbi:unnamed protein product [Cuscuta europaea]|uniref:Uncharacterized protein n=1 Tax=Cuscuta europaea TaxID=41803 RepID=A0A9P0Z5P0_CUSEU|nr:unnamed protein product [Cuscuta europaea]